MVRRFTLCFLAASSALILLSLLWPGRPAEVLFALLVTALPVALMALGASRRGRLGGLGVAFLLLLVWLEGLVLAILLLGGDVLAQPRVAGLPLKAALQVYGLGLGTLVFVVLAYALFFDAGGLSEQDLEAIRKRREAAEDREDESCPS